MVEERNLNLKYIGEYKFGKNLYLPIKIELSEINDLVEKNDSDYNCDYSHIYKFKKYKNEMYKFFKFIDIEIMNDSMFELDIEYEIEWKDSKENVDYKTVEDCLYFITSKAVYEFVLSQNPFMRDELLNEYQHFIIEKANMILGSYIEKLKRAFGIGRKRVEDTGWLYHEFYTAYGKHSNGAYFKENSPNMSFENKSFREQIAVKLFRSREIEIQNIINEEAKIKANANKK